MCCAGGDAGRLTVDAEVPEDAERVEGGLCGRGTVFRKTHSLETAARLDTIQHQPVRSC